MSDSSLHTTQLVGWVARIRAGDREAREQLFRRVIARLERLARKMLRTFPDVARANDTGDLLTAAALRLDRALHRLEPQSVSHFFRVVAHEMRCELLDLAKRLRGPRQRAVEAGPLPPAGAGAEPGLDLPDRSSLDVDIDRWAAFHEAVAQLAPRQREVVSLLFYHGWTQAEAADVLQVSEKTVSREWTAACLELHDRLKDLLPE